MPYDLQSFSRLCIAWPRNQRTLFCHIGKQKETYEITKQPRNSSCKEWHKHHSFLARRRNRFKKTRKSTNARTSESPVNKIVINQKEDSQRNYTIQENQYLSFRITAWKWILHKEINVQEHEEHQTHEYQWRTQVFTVQVHKYSQHLEQFYLSNEYSWSKIWIF